MTYYAIARTDYAIARTDYVIARTDYVIARTDYVIARTDWHGTVSATDAIALERLQCSIARKILRADWSTPKESLLRTLNWPTLRWRREVISMTLFFDIVFSRPSALSNCIRCFPFVHTKVNRIRTLRKPLQILLPRAKSSRYANSFFFRSAVLWNTLPHNILSLNSSRKFRQTLEQHWKSH